jgi:hypothetical protein
MSFFFNNENQTKNGQFLKNLRNAKISENQICGNFTFVTKIKASGAGLYKIVTTASNGKVEELTYRKI